ncbi:MAG TPA: hypothetical protein VFW09_15450 [Solirubrobacteraceae bacterium]|nr:hypothetical protein [Solirubrobacteraceae bacterium]
MSVLSGGDWTGGSTDRRVRAEHVELRKRRAQRDGVVASGTIACARCDAPVAIGPGELPLLHPLTCPFCGHHGAAREFLSLAVPTRPTRVQVRVRIRDAG